MSVFQIPEQEIKTGLGASWKLDAAVIDDAKPITYLATRYAPDRPLLVSVRNSDLGNIVIPEKELIERLRAFLTCEVAKVMTAGKRLTDYIPLHSVHYSKQINEVIQDAPRLADLIQDSINEFILLQFGPLELSDIKVYQTARNYAQVLTWFPGRKLDGVRRVFSDPLTGYEYMIRLSQLVAAEKRPIICMEVVENGDQ